MPAKLTDRSLVTEEEYLKKLHDLRGPNYSIVGKYKAQTKPITLKHATCGKITKHNNAAQILNSVYGCDCERTSLIPFARLNEREKDFIAFCYQQLRYSVDQINQVTGVLISTIRKVLAAEEVKDDLNSTNGTRRSLENIKTGTIDDKQLYYKLADSLTNRIFNAYADIIDPKSLRASAFHLDHKFSRNAAFSKDPQPLNLKLLCHPANLRIIKGADNLRKQALGSLNITQLKREIKKFEARYGEVKFPESLQYEVFRTLRNAESKGITVLGLDPGVRNFGVFGGRLFGVKTLHGVTPIETCMFKNTIDTLKEIDFEEKLCAYMEELKTLLAKVQPDVIVIERYQTRGPQGTNVEFIGCMIGVTFAVASAYAAEAGKHVIMKPIIASQWKNALNKKVNLDAMYEMLGSPKLHHRLDALLMALYAFPDKDVYSFLTPARQKKITDFIKSNA